MNFIIFSLEEICALPKKDGIYWNIPCFRMRQVWFFNSETRECEEFMYGGCLGNDNNFNTLEGCEIFCRYLPVPDQASSQPKIEDSSQKTE